MCNNDHSTFPALKKTSFHAMVGRQIPITSIPMIVAHFRYDTTMIVLKYRCLVYSMYFYIHTYNFKPERRAKYEYTG